MAMKSLVGRVGPSGEGERAKNPSGGKAPGAAAEHSPPPTLHLGHEHMKALGLHKGQVPYKVGDKVLVHALVHVGSISEDQDSGPSGGKAKGGEGNTRRTMALHFHKMDMGDGDNSGQKEESQKEGMKSEIDKALSREAGGKGRGEGKGNAPAPRGGEDNEDEG